MGSINRRSLCLLAGAACLMGSAVAQRDDAAPVSPEDARDMREVIEAQLAAFAADNAERAFSYASASIREMFGTPEYFMAMVRGGYPVVYRPRTVGFLLPETRGSEVVQRVRMTDASGTAWLAIYNMQRQADRRWLINGCVVTRDSGRSA